MRAHQNGTPMLASSGYVCDVDVDLCIGCGTCEEICQFGAVSVLDAYSIIHYEQCMGCGVCIEHCTQEALSLIRDKNKGIPLEISKLLEQAATSSPI